MTYHRALCRRRYLNSRHFYTRVDLDDVGVELATPGSDNSRFENSGDGVFGKTSVQKVFEDLSENQRQTLQGYTLAEIAVKLNQTRGNVKHRVLPFAGESTWRHVWTLYGAGILLAVALGVCVYQFGMHRGADTAKLTLPPLNAQPQTSLEGQVSDAAHERQITLAQLEQRDREIAGSCVSNLNGNRSK